MVFCAHADMTYGAVPVSRAASFNLGQATSAQVRTTASYRVQVEAAWQGTNISVPVCGARLGRSGCPPRPLAAVWSGYGWSL